MKHLVIGGSGFIGGGVALQLEIASHDCLRWFRQDYDLLRRSGTLPIADFIYLCAGTKGYANCDKNPRESWTVNVDSQIDIARYYAEPQIITEPYTGQIPPHPFIIYISSDAVEFSNSNYAIQRRHVEAYMNTINAAIIRPGPISEDRSIEFAKLVIDTAIRRKRGLTRWQ